MKLKIKEGTTNKLIRVFIQDATSTTGGGKTGLVAANLNCYRHREGDAAPATQLSLADGTTGTHDDGDIDEIDATNMPGLYELSLSDAIIDATSEGSVLIMIKDAGSNDVVPCIVEIELDKIDYRSDSWEPLLTAAGEMYIGTVDNTNVTPTTTVFATSDITTIAGDHWNDRRIVFTSGTLAGQMTDITDYELDTGDGKFTVTALTAAPSNGDSFIVV